MSTADTVPAAGLTTDVFRATPGSYVRRVMGMWCGRWWWTMALPIVVCAALTLVEPMWLFVAMMILFLLVPGVMSLVYYRYALTTEAMTAIQEKTVTVGEKALTMHLCESGKEKRIAAADIVSVEDTGRTLVVRLKGGRYNHLAIPVSAIPADVRTAFVARLLALSPRR